MASNADTVLSESTYPALSQFWDSRTLAPRGSNPPDREFKTHRWTDHFWGEHVQFPNSGGWLIAPHLNDGTVIYLKTLDSCVSEQHFDEASGSQLRLAPQVTTNRSFQENQFNWVLALDEILTDLGRLETNWDGEGAEAPSEKLLTNMDHALRALPRDTRTPEVEIDPTDGAISLRWWSGNDKSVFSLTFTKAGKVYGVTTSSEGNDPPAFECVFSEEMKIVEALNYDLLAAVPA